MEITNSTTAASNSNFLPEGSSDPYGNLGFEEFIDLLVAELTNQDPMEPMSNSDLMNQIGQIREIASTDQLTKTLDAVMLSQTLATAGNVVDKVVDGMTDMGTRMCGTVISVALEGGKAILQVEDKDGNLHSVKLNNLANIYPEGTPLPTPGYLKFFGESAGTEAEADPGTTEGDAPNEVEESDTVAEVATSPSEETENESTGDDASSSSAENIQTAA
jgi:flagellar basal-body rod modification protein FlgD